MTAAELRARARAREGSAELFDVPVVQTVVLSGVWLVGSVCLFFAFRAFDPSFWFVLPSVVPFLLGAFMVAEDASSRRIARRLRDEAAALRVGAAGEAAFSRVERTVSAARRRRLVLALAIALGAIVGLSACSNYGTSGGTVTDLRYQPESGSLLGWSGECWRVEYRDDYGRTGRRCESEATFRTLSVGDVYGTPAGPLTESEVSARRVSDRLQSATATALPVMAGALALGWLVVAAQRLVRGR